MYGLRITLYIYAPYMTGRIPRRHTSINTECQLTLAWWKQMYRLAMAQTSHHQEPSTFHDNLYIQKLSTTGNSRECYC